jgi:hypothetical protein
MTCLAYISPQQVSGADLPAPVLHRKYKTELRFDVQGRLNSTDSTVHDFRSGAEAAATLQPKGHPFMPPSLVWSCFQDFKLVTANRLVKLEEELAILTESLADHPEGIGGSASNHYNLRRIWLNKHGQWEALKHLEISLKNGEVTAAFK